MDFNIDNHEVELRRLVGERVGVFASDEHWDWWFEEIRDETFFTLEQAAEALIDRIRGARRHMPRRVGPNGHEVYSFGTSPAWWADHARNKLDKWRDAQSQVLAAFDLDAPMTLKAADAMLVSALDSQEHVGARLVFEFTHYPTPERDHFGPDPDDPDPEVIEQGMAYSGNTYGWAGDRRAEEPLYVLATYAGMLEWQMGCRPFQAVDFLLCNEPFDLPWVGVDMRQGSGVIELRISSPSVPAGDVTKAYVAAVAAVRKSQPDVLASAPKRRRARRGRTLALLEFVYRECPEAKSLADWRELRIRWNATHPAWGFPTPQAMRERYRRVKDTAAREHEG